MLGFELSQGFGAHSWLSFSSLLGNREAPPLQILQKLLHEGKKNDCAEHGA